MSEDHKVLQKMDMNTEEDITSVITPFEVLYSNFENYSEHYTEEDLIILKEYITK
jgi:hypothetical protein